MFTEILFVILKIFLIILPLLIFIAYLTYFERKVIGAMQLRKGPNVVGPFGLFQPIADGIKLLTKETIFPDKSSKFLFVLSPILTFALALLAWAVIPIDYKIVLSDINVGLMYIFAISSLGVYGVIVAGWSSNSRYAFRSLRSAAQMISYEVSIGLIIISVLLSSGSLNLTQIVLSQKELWYVIPHFPMFVIFLYLHLLKLIEPLLICQKLSQSWLLVITLSIHQCHLDFFFLGEYGNMILMSSMSTILFLGGWLPPFGGNILRLFQDIFGSC